jgi:4-amino-4-deoxy-L-arabinose transferase-like glycosyltransferase
VKHFTGDFNQFSISYLGKLYPINSLPWHYMGAHILAVTPLPMLLSLLFGASVLLRDWRSRGGPFGASFLIFLILVPLLARLFPGALQYDGMRHVFIVVPPLAIIAGAGFDRAMCLTRSARWGPLLQPILMVAVPCWLLWQAIGPHPYQGSYLNEAVRIALPPDRLSAYFDFHSWGAPMHHAVRWVNEKAPENAVLCVPNQRHLLQYYNLRRDLIVVDSGPSDFVMFPSWRSDLSETFKEEPAFSVQCYGTELFLVYRGSSDL